MATKTLSRPEKTNRPRVASPQNKLGKLIEKHQALAKELMDLMEELEDAEDGRRLEEAIKRNKNKPLIPWAEAKKRLGLD
jgi:hypothetical protein